MAFIIEDGFCVLCYFSSGRDIKEKTLKYLWLLSIVHDKIHLIEVNYLIINNKSKILTENLLNFV